MLTQTIEFSAALRRSIEGVIVIVILLIISGAATALPGGGTYVLGVTLATVIQLIIGLIVIGVLLGIRAPMSIVVDHYVATYLKLQELPDRAKYTESIRAIASAVVSLILITLIYFSFISPLSYVLWWISWILGVLFFLVGMAFLFTIYRRSRPIISDVSERLAKKIEGTTAAGTMFCISCGASIPRDAKFCNVCGAKV